jgi:3-deoxy-manno-octulosonate cytidylyltransferase (CMP-KDO synthetase)
VSVAAIIPARYASTRFPGKPLATIAGKAMIQRVYEAAAKSAAETVIVATDDERIADCVRAFGGQVAMTRADHQTGTDRIAEVAAKLDAELILNIQGDEPFIPPAVIDRLIAEMLADSAAAMGTIAVPMEPADFANPNAVKVVLDAAGRALYFSRAAIPHCRDGGPEAVAPLHHWGIYAFRRDFLFQFITWPPSPLEQCEKLEQLRAMENGAKIRVLVEAEKALGVDTPEDLARIEMSLFGDCRAGN